MRFQLNGRLWVLILNRILHERPPIHAEIGLLVDEIVELIGNFQFVFCNHVPKGCNLLTRVLASDALAKSGPSACFEDYPPWLSHNDIINKISTIFISKKKKKILIGHQCTSYFLTFTAKIV
jgi:hypothetical protein